MANELQVNASLQVRNGNFIFPKRGFTQQFTQTNPRGGVPGNVLIGTAWERVLLPDLTTPGWVRMQNQDSVNFVDWDSYRKVATVTNKALTANVATLTTSAAHGFFVGESVTVAGVDATFNGTYTITAVPSATTFSYAKVAADVASVASGGTAEGSPTKPAMGRMKANEPALFRLSPLAELWMKADTAACWVDVQVMDN